MVTNAPPDFSNKKVEYSDCLWPTCVNMSQGPKPSAEGPQQESTKSYIGLPQLIFRVHMSFQKTLCGVLLDMLTRQTRLGGIHLRFPTLRSFCKPFHFPGNQNKPNITNIKPIRISELEHTRVE